MSSSARYSALTTGAASDSADSMRGGSGAAAPPLASAYAPAAVAPLSKYKVVFIGDSGAGKTSLIKNFIYGTFDSSHNATIGIDFMAKTMYLDDRTVRLQIWDSAGQASDLRGSKCLI